MTRHCLKRLYLSLIMPETEVVRAIDLSKRGLYS